MRKLIIPSLKRNSLLKLSVLIFGLLAGFVESAATVAQQSIFDVLSYQDMLEVNLELDLATVKSNRRSKDAFKATLSFTDQNGAVQTWKTKVEQRGKFRRTKCMAMPPLRLNFKKNDLTEAGLAPFDDLKLVTHCIEDGKDAKELLLKEYLAYKLYNEITEESFRVQFLEINYKDVNTGELQKQWGFLIEDTAQLRARLDYKKIKNPLGLTAEKVHRDAFKRVALFQYMIGNADWNISSSQNVKMLKKGEKVIAIPYDFDFSALVSAPYARLNDTYNQTTLEERFYLGYPEDLEDLEATLSEFAAKKEVLFQLVKDFDLLRGKTRRGILAYLKSFYKNIDEIKLPVAKPAVKVEATNTALGK